MGVGGSWWECWAKVSDSWLQWLAAPAGSHLSSWEYLPSSPPSPLLPLNNYTQRYTAIIQAKVQMIIWRPSLNLYQSKHTSLNDWYFRFQKETQFNRNQLLMWKHQYLKKGGTRQGLSLDQQHFSESSPASECSALSAWHDFSTRFWRLIQGVHK